MSFSESDREEKLFTKEKLEELWEYDVEQGNTNLTFEGWLKFKREN